MSVCGTRYGFTPAGRIEGNNPGPIEVCPETAQVIADLGRINKRVAEQAEPQTQGAEIKTASLSGPISFLGGPAATGSIANKLGENFERRVAPRAPRAGVSETLTRPLPCSLALSSCRRYAALREQLAHKASLKLEEPEREKARAPKKKKSAKKKHSRRHYAEESRGRRSRYD